MADQVVEASGGRQTAAVVGIPEPPGKLRELIFDILGKSEIGITLVLFLDQGEESDGNFWHPNVHPLFEQNFAEAVVEKASALWGSDL